MLSFFSSRRNWDSSSPPPFWGEGHTRWRERGWESPMFQRGYIHCGTLYIYVLCALPCLSTQTLLATNKTRSSDLSSFAQILPGFLKLLTATALGLRRHNSLRVFTASMPSCYGVIIRSELLLPLCTRVMAS